MDTDFSLTINGITYTAMWFDKEDDCGPYWSIFVDARKIGSYAGYPDDAKHVINLIRNFSCKLVENEKHNIKVWIVAIFRQAGPNTYQMELMNLFTFSSLQKANEFLKTKYVHYGYDDYQIYESYVDSALSPWDKTIKEFFDER